LAKLFKRYVERGGKVSVWIAQVEVKPAGIVSAIRGCVRRGAKAVFIEGGRTDGLFPKDDPGQIERYCALTARLSRE